jgi:crotonobetainyl-CoA:carnitine CoA-transferase CaiB-like acyl-CoA transferase
MTMAFPDGLHSGAQSETETGAPHGARGNQDNDNTDSGPLAGLVVLDFCQYLAGPSATLRLADLGARVIKVERPGSGDGSRRLALQGLVSDGDAVNFHTINRNKESIELNTKDPEGLRRAQKLIAQADVLVESFRPGVMDRMGLGYEAVHELNPRLVYASITGYGTVGPWVGKPGQDLLVQSLSGLTWLNGDADQPPMPFALSLADSYTGVHAVEGILAALGRRQNSGLGAHVEVSLLSSILDLQFEVISTYLNDGHKPPQRAAFRNAHPYLAAPYGIYDTADGSIALAMGSVSKLGKLIGSPAVAARTDESAWFSDRDLIKRDIAVVLATGTTAHWLGILEPAGVWCSDVYTWEQLVGSEAFKALDFIQDVARDGGQNHLYTTRCPISFLGSAASRSVSRPAPRLGEQTEKITQEFGLEQGTEEGSTVVHKSEPRPTPGSGPILSTGGGVPSRPLAGLKVLDFGQFLSAPSAALRLADMGADVLKIERPGTGDICRHMYISDCVIDGDSSLFHAINRNKKSLALDLKAPESQKIVAALVKEADIALVNFRPGVAAHLGVSYDQLKALNPALVYGEITGWGYKGPWRDKPGQDLLVQALSGACWLNGNADQPPTPFGLSIADLFAGQDLVQGVLAGVLQVRRGGAGSHVHVSLLEAILDAQFEVFTTYLNGGGLPQRSAVNNANAYIDAPYGIYETADGYLALAMIPIPRLGELLGCEALQEYTNPESWHTQRDEIKRILACWLVKETTAHWLEILEPADVWCADVYTWDRLMHSEAFAALEMTQTVERADGTKVAAMRCPIRFDGVRADGGDNGPGAQGSDSGGTAAGVGRAAPTVGQDTEEVLARLGFAADSVRHSTKG